MKSKVVVRRRRFALKIFCRWSSLVAEWVKDPVLVQSLSLGILYAMATAKKKKIFCSMVIGNYSGEVKTKKPCKNAFCKISYASFKK